jgi:hypothetical protein
MSSTRCVTCWSERYLRAEIQAIVAALEPPVTKKKSHKCLIL